MKPPAHRELIALAILGLLSTINSPVATLRAQSTVFTYQGRLTDNSTNFSGAGQFKFAIVTSSNVNHTATATANPPSGGFITGYAVSSGGNGYVTAPIVTVSGGGGSGAAAHANISGGAVISISVDNPGNGGYTSAPTVTIAPPPANLSYATFWSNDGSSVNGSEPSAAVAVGVNNGLFTVVLGDATQPNMTNIPASLFNQPNLQLRIWFNDGVNGSAALSPVQNLTPVPYAVVADSATSASSASNLLGTLPVSQLSGTISATQLPAAVVTNNQTSLNLSGTFGGSFNGSYSGNGSGLTNLSGALPWQIVSGTTQQAQPNTGYVVTNNSLTTITLPVLANPGDLVRVSCIGAGGWKITQNIGQKILAGNLTGGIGITWNATARDLGGRSWISVASSADGTKLVAAILANDIFTSSDSGGTWTPQTNGNNGSQQWLCVASSADGTKLVAVTKSLGVPPGGQISTSSDSGATWTNYTLGGLVANNSWLSVASSADGSKLAVVANQVSGSSGQIYTSTNSGTNWTAQAGAPVTNWVSIASSSDGTRLVALVAGGQIYTSGDSGVTWTARDSSRNWISVASSSDGTKLVAAVGGGQIYTSMDSGTNWTPRDSNRSWTCVASSSDGSRLVATVTFGQIYTSSDSGATWMLQNGSGSLNWAAVASSADGTKLVAVVDGGFIFTSVPTALSGTTAGTAGYLVGGQNTAIELQYMGGGQWMPLSYVGVIFAY